jgi:isoleucyl-tRNA synthetase
MAIIAQKSITLLAPILTYTIDEVLEYATDVVKGDANSVFDLVYTPMPEIEVEFDEVYMKEAREKFFETVDQLKKDKKIKATLELVVQTTSSKFNSLEKVDAEDWFTVSKVITHEEDGELGSFEVDGDKFKILLGTKAKCPRCWKHRSKDEESLCERCREVIS